MLPWYVDKTKWRNRCVIATEGRSNLVVHPNMLYSIGMTSRVLYNNSTDHTVRVLRVMDAAVSCEWLHESQAISIFRLITTCPLFLIGNVEHSTSSHLKELLLFHISFVTNCTWCHPDLLMTSVRTNPTSTQEYWSMKDWQDMHGKINEVRRSRAPREATPSVKSISGALHSFGRRKRSPFLLLF